MYDKAIKRVNEDYAITTLRSQGELAADALNFSSYQSMNKIIDNFSYDDRLLIEKHYLYDAVNSVESVGKQMTYDVSVRKDHSFIGNGIISHNTMLDVLYLYFLAIFYPRYSIKYYFWNKRKSS